MSIRNLAIATLVSALATTSAQAAPPHLPDLVESGNRWLITAYDDSSKIHQQWATQGICFYRAGTRGTQQLYYWVSDTFPDWNGRAAQEGDQVFMHGDYAREVGHDGMQWSLTTMSARDEGYGHWHEWREDTRLGRTIGFANAKLVRSGRCKPQTHEEAVELYRQLEYRYTDEGERIVTPHGLTERQLEALK